MKSYLGILSSDIVNRDGYLLTFGCLEKGIADNALKGIPSLIDHDFHRPFGWIFPFGIFVEPKISKTIGNFLICENAEDRNIVHPKIQKHWQSINREGCKDYIDEFKALLKDCYNGTGQFINKGCVAYNQKDIALMLYPSLFEKVDKNGLLYLDDLLSSFDYVGSGIFKSKHDGFCIFCHQYFKRSLSLANNYNTYFIDEFIKLNTKKDISLRIAIDKNLIGLAKTHTGVLEFDYWWGPKFNDDVSSIPDGVTRHEMQDEQRLLNGISGTEFWWKTDGNEKTLEIEEIRDSPSLGVSANSFGCRYIHSIYNSDQSEFVHFDGAIRLYSEDSIMARWDNSINKAGKNTDYTKLFRIDGKLELADWKKLCILYYKSNSLLFEYFGAKEEYESLRSTPAEQNQMDKYFPYKVSKDDGIRLFVSYHNKEEDYGSFDRKVINPDVIKFQDGNVLKVLEYDIVEIDKYLKRHGGKLEYPDGVQFLKAFDFYTNYPIILHGSQNTTKAIQDTLKAFKTIFDKQNQKFNKTICFSIAWEMERYEARLSIFGKSSEIARWLELNEHIPVGYEEFREWLSLQRDWIYNNYEYTGQDFTHLLKNDGVICIERTPIDKERITFPDPDDPSYFEVRAKRDEEIDHLIKNQVIYPSYYGLIREAVCSKTGQDYFNSDTSKYLDDDVKMVIKEIELLGLFWTDEEYH